MKRDKIVNNLTERLCSNAKSAVPIVDVFCLQAKLSPGRYNLYGNSLEFQVKYIWEKNDDDNADRHDGNLHFLDAMAHIWLVTQTPLTATASTLQEINFIIISQISAK